MKTKSYKIYIFLILIFFFLVIVSLNVRAYDPSGKTIIYCFGWDDCSNPTCGVRSLECPDDRPGYNVYCKPTSQHGGMLGPFSGAD